VSGRVKKITPDHYRDRDGCNVATAKALFETSDASNASEDDSVPASWEDVEDSDFADIKASTAASSDCCSDSTADEDWFSVKPGQLGATKWSMTFHKQLCTPPVQYTKWVPHTSKSFSAGAAMLRSKNTTKKNRKHSLNLYRPGINDKDDKDGDSTVHWSQQFKTRYEGVTTRYIDSHCHLDFLFKRSGFSGSFAKYRSIFSDTFPPSFAGCVSIFCNPKMWAYESEGKFRYLSYIIVMIEYVAELMSDI